jgi:hypothetical protein
VVKGGRRVRPTASHLYISQPCRPPRPVTGIALLFVQLLWILINTKLQYTQLRTWITAPPPHTHTHTHTQRMHMCLFFYTIYLLDYNFCIILYCLSRNSHHHQQVLISGSGVGVESFCKCPRIYATQRTILCRLIVNWMGINWRTGVVWLHPEDSSIAHFTCQSRGLSLLHPPTRTHWDVSSRIKKLITSRVLLQYLPVVIS